MQVFSIVVMIKNVLTFELHCHNFTSLNFVLFLFFVEVEFTESVVRVLLVRSCPVEAELVSTVVQDIHDTEVDVGEDHDLTVIDSGLYGDGELVTFHLFVRWHTIRQKSFEWSEPEVLFIRFDDIHVQEEWKVVVFTFTWS